MWSAQQSYGTDMQAQLTLSDSRQGQWHSRGCCCWIHAGLMGCWWSGCSSPCCSCPSLHITGLLIRIQPFASWLLSWLLGNKDCFMAREWKKQNNFCSEEQILFRSFLPSHRRPLQLWSDQHFWLTGGKDGQALHAPHRLHRWLRSGEVPCMGPAWPQVWYPAAAATAGLGINALSHLLMRESLCTALWSDSYGGHIWSEKLHFLWNEVGRHFNTSEHMFQVSSGDREVKTS